jgi:hypothetical protein
MVVLPQRTLRAGLWRARDTLFRSLHHAGGLAIRSGDQHGLNVIVVLDQQSLDRSGRPMQAGSEIFSQRLPMREDLPLEGDGPATGEKGDGAFDIAVVPGVINVDLVFPTSGAKCRASAARFGNCRPW